MNECFLYLVGGKKSTTLNAVQPGGLQIMSYLKTEKSETKISSPLNG